ncbi:hypothetical protein OF83DRAFT_1172193 [Amylostereum chailletii]|nr:hypothetical protein OF83DRAFT_1172193 [Amylostereum chailletii]
MAFFRSSSVDESSDIYSLYSHPAIAQADNATDGLPVSNDYSSLANHAKRSVSGPRTMGARRDIDTGVFSSEAESGSYGRRGVLSPVEEYIQEPYEEYFTPSPRQPRQKAQALREETLQRHRSTKELINRFETMTPPDILATPQHRKTPMQGLFAPPSKPEKKTSPLRQSFRNLISVFKKGKKSTAKDKDDPFSILPQLDLALKAMSKEDDGGGYKAHTFDPGSRFCTSPSYALHSGEILHLSRPSPVSSPILPVWMPCSAVLHSTHMLLTCPTAHGVPSTEVISLSSCTDARSISSRNMDAQEQALLPAMGDAGTPHVFEISFVGKESQRFAAPTVKERTAWVSAVWDAVLHSQDKSAHERTKSVLTIDTTMSALQKTLSDITGYAEPSSRFSTHSHTGANTSERALPPLPPPKLARTSSNYSTDTSTPVASSTRPSRLSIPSPISPFSTSLPTSPTTPTTPRRTFGANTLPPPPSPTGRTPSPSIRNLGQKSVVKQRLAAIQRTSSNASTSSRLTTPMSSVLNTAPTSVRSSAIRSSAIKRQEESLAFPLPPLPFELDRGLTSVPMSSPTSSVGSSRPKSAFRMRDEMRNARLGRAPSSNSSSTSPVERNTSGGDHIDALLDVMDAHAERQTDQTKDVAERVNVVGVDVKAMRDRIERNGEGLADMAGKVDALRREIVREREEDKKKARDEIHVLANERPQSKEGPALAEGLQDVKEKLDALLAKSPLDASTSGETATEILTLLQNEQNQRVLQMDQQAESVRYLAELNSWLEAFVNNGTAHIQSVAVGVQKLCHELGIPDEAVAQDACANPGEPRTTGHPSETSLLGNLRSLLVQNEMRERQSAGLQATVQGLTAALHEGMQKNAEMRNAYTTESVIGFIDQQRQDQERQLKTLASELSNEIRGERLRFVEAMKEATAINIQVHVEEFKKELTREVLLMTHEVGRLQRERQSLEHQIGELFAFYAKQQQKAPEMQQRSRSDQRHRPRSQAPIDGQSMLQQSRSDGGRRRTLPAPPPGGPMQY